MLDCITAADLVTKVCVVHPPPQSSFYQLLTIGTSLLAAAVGAGVALWTLRTSLKHQSLLKRLDVEAKRVEIHSNYFRIVAQEILKLSAKFLALRPTHLPSEELASVLNEIQYNFALLHDDGTLRRLTELGVSFRQDSMSEDFERNKIEAIAEIRRLLREAEERSLGSALGGTS